MFLIKLSLFTTLYSKNLIKWSPPLYISSFSACVFEGPFNIYKGLIIGLLQLYRLEGENKMAQQAFDRARSIEPSLALPWAGMSADADTR